MLTPEQEVVVERAQQPRFSGTVTNATHTATGANMSCGDEVAFELRVDEHGLIQEIKHSSRACTICTASADLLAESLIGTPVSEVAYLSAHTHLERIALPLSPIRQKCALLPLETLTRLTAKE